MTYEPDEFMEKCIAGHDLTSIKRVLTSSIYFDPTFESDDFDAGVRYVTQIRKLSIWDPFNGQPPLMAARVDKKDTTLTTDDFAISVSNLSRNFCQERIDDVKKLGKYCYGSSRKPTTPPSPTEVQRPNVSAPPVQRQRVEGAEQNRVLKTAALTVAAVIAVVAAIAFLIKLFK